MGEGKALVIAEKPSVAGDIAKTLGVKKSGDIYENDQYVISYAIGHLVGLEMPEDIDKKKYGFWTLKTLPIIPETFGLKPIKNTKPQYMELKKLLKRKDIDYVINACDAGREGELIFSYIYDLSKSKKPIKRLWMQSMTKASIIDAFANLKDESEIVNLRDAAKCRSEADWLIGLNATRAVTKRACGRSQTATVGRVQTPTLALVCKRENEIRNFQSRKYWNFEATFELASGQYTGLFQIPEFVKVEGDKDSKVDRIFDGAFAEKLYNELKAANGSMVDVSDTAKRTRQSSPLLYDLTSLQREANSRFGYSATRTLQIAQALYEKHKMITYPRTDSRALPEDYLGTCCDTLRKLNGYSEFTSQILNNNWVKPNKRIFNNARISDHFAIIPTGESKSLDVQEQNIYDMITKRFIAIFFPPAEFDETVRTTIVNSHTFKTHGKVLVVPGWQAVYGKMSSDQESLVPITTADGSPTQSKYIDILADEKFTKPPAHYTEATLLSAMENAGKMVDDEELALAMKEKGLGTPATRASIIEKLFSLDYLQRDGRYLIPTSKADHIIGFLENVGSDFLTQAELTGEWESKLNQIEHGKFSRVEFMKAIVGQTTEMIDRIKGWEDAGEVVESLVSFTDQQPMLEKARNYVSQDGALSIYKNIGNRPLSFDEVKELVANKKIGPFDNFRSKMGKPYSATLFLDEENKVKFEFAPREGESAEPDPVDAAMLEVLVDVKWAEPEKKGRRVYDDKAFYESLKDQSTKRQLSPAQKNALKKILEKYAEQIPNYETVASAFGLTSAADKQELLDKINKAITKLETVTEWAPATGKGRARKDDKKLFESFKNQFEKKGTLSAKQLTALETMVGKYF